MTESKSLGKRIAIAADHRGVALKKRMIEALSKDGFQVANLGVDQAEPSCDYPDVAFPLSEAVASGRFDAGILVCMSGTGMAICANKVKGVRAAICDNIEHARLSREHNNANVLILGSAFVDDDTALKIAREWISVPFEGGRHEKRVRKISDYENKHCS